MDDLHESFSLFDKKGNGTVESTCIGELLRAAGQNPTEAEISQLIEEIDPNRNKPLSYDAFVEILHRFQSRGDNNENAEKYIQGFQAFDKDGNGFISCGELRYVLTRLGEQLSEIEVDDILKDMEIDNQGMVNYIHFVNMIMAG